VPEAIRKAVERARKTMVRVPMAKGTIPYAMQSEFGARSVFLRPASDGTGVIAGGGIRAVVELAGIQNVLTKCLGSHNPHNMVKATMAALAQLDDPNAIASRRGKTLAQLVH